MLSKIRKKIKPWIESVAKPFASAGFTPNHITFIALAVGIVAAYLFAVGKSRIAGIVVLVCGFFDVIDGAVARITGDITKFGGVLDSVFDRITDAILYLGILVGGINSLFGEPIWVLPFVALVGSYMVSYVRARAESAGSGKLDVGIAERAERLIIIAVGAVVGLMSYSLLLIAILTFITVIQRIWAARGNLE